jgi:hypothetical protein
MIDPDPFLTTLYVMGDDFCKTSLPREMPPGPQAALTRSEVVTLALLGPWPGLGRDRGFSRSAQRHVRAALPAWPGREPCPRPGRQHDEALGACLLPLVPLLAAQRCPYEALDSSGLPTRAAKRRGAGWWPGLAAIGWRHRWGGYEGVQLLVAVSPCGASTGFGVGAARTQAPPLAEPCLALRWHPQPGLTRVGAPACGPYGVEKGFEGRANPAPWGRV